MKTAMQELIEALEKDGLELFGMYEFLEKEKQQIIEAYEKGTEDGINDGGEAAENYYNEKILRIMKTIQYLENTLEKYSDCKDLVQWDNLFDFELNYRNKIISSELLSRIEYLNSWKNNIGKEVYLSNRSFNYALVSEFPKLDHLNQSCFDANDVILFTEELFDKLVIDYIKYQIERLTKYLTDGEIYYSGGRKLNSLVYEWKIESKQVLLRIFKDSLE